MEHRKYDKFNYVPSKKITQLLFLRALYHGNQLGEGQSQLVAHASHNYNRSNYYKNPSRCKRVFLIRGSSTTMYVCTNEVKIIFISPVFLEK